MREKKLAASKTKKSVVYVRTWRIKGGENSRAGLSSGRLLSTIASRKHVEDGMDDLFFLCRVEPDAVTYILERRFLYQIIRARASAWRER